MLTINGAVLTFLLNSLWQIPVLLVVAFLCHLVTRNSPARHQHILWVTVLMFSLVLPLCSTLTLGERFPLPLGSSAEGAAAQDTNGGQGINVAHDGLTDFFYGEPMPVPTASTLSTVLVGCYFLFLFIRSVRLWRVWKRTKEVRLAAHTGALSNISTDTSLLCQSAFKLSPPVILCSSKVAVPLTVGWWRPVIILPAHLQHSSAELLLSALGHEMAHIRRRDFLLNLLYEVVFLPISFHPAAALMRRKINQTREMACDELVAERLVETKIYARSLVSIASSIPPVGRPDFSLGICAAGNLEERIMKLMERRRVRESFGKFALTLALIALTISGATASALSLKVGQERGASAASADRIIGTWRAMSDDSPDLPAVELAVRREGDKLEGKATFFEIRERKVAGKQELPLIDPKFDGKTLSFKVQGPGGQLFGAEVMLVSENRAEMRRAGDNVPAEMRNQVMKLSRVK